MISRIKRRSNLNSSRPDEAANLATLKSVWSRKARPQNDLPVGVVMAPRGRLFRALSFTITRGKIVQIDVIADPERLRQLDLAVLND